MEAKRGKSGKVFGSAGNSVPGHVHQPPPRNASRPDDALALPDRAVIWEFAGVEAFPRPHGVVTLHRVLEEP